MGSQIKILSSFMVCLLLVLSYQYVIDETSDAATADPTHTGKAFLANIMPYLWLMFIILALVVALLEVFSELG